MYVYHLSMNVCVPVCLCSAVWCASTSVYLLIYQASSALAQTVTLEHLITDCSVYMCVSGGAR